MGRTILANALRRLPSGVNVITAGRSPNRSGYTGTAFFSLSFEPQRVLISVNRNSSAFPVIRDADAFAVNLLSTDQQDIAERFAGKHGTKGEDRYARANWRTGELGVSLLDGAVTNFECHIEEIIERHSHALIIGEVVSVAIDETREALVYHDARYGAVASPALVSSSALAAE
jgi:flavin reductase (DIM6/NTAB) family NADH-FMN oxidoreductase RutF